MEYNVRIIKEMVKKNCSILQNTQHFHKTRIFQEIWQYSFQKIKQFFVKIFNFGQTIQFSEENIENFLQNIPTFPQTLDKNKNLKFFFGISNNFSRQFLTALNKPWIKCPNLQKKNLRKLILQNILNFHTNKIFKKFNNYFQKNYSKKIEWLGSNFRPIILIFGKLLKFDQLFSKYSNNSIKTTFFKNITKTGIFLEKFKENCHFKQIGRTF